MAGNLNRRTLLKGAASLAGAQALAPATALSQPLEELGEAAERSIAPPECLQTSGPHMSLAGTWSIRLDPKGQGSAQRWFERELHGESIFLPGNTDQGGYGDRVNEPAVGHLSRPFTYTGPAWYECSFDLPEAWVGTRISLFLERCHWQTSVWLDGQPFGSQNSLSVPHIYDFGTRLAAGSHRITLCVDNTLKIDLGATAHAITEQTQGNWNGIVGKIEIRSTPLVSIENIRIFPELASRTARIEVTLHNAAADAVAASLQASVRGSEAHTSVDIPAWSGDKATQLELRLPAPLHLWDEHQPSPYIVDITLRTRIGERELTHTLTAPLAIREIATRGTQITLNGRPIFLRGTVENAIFPITGYPPMDLEPWRRIFRILADYGMNHLRFHSYCPPEAAFQAADEAGFLLHIELPVFSHHVLSTHGLPQFMREEGKRILKTYGNHPSFAMLCMGNELKDGWEFMDQLVAEFKQMDKRHLYTYSTNNGRDTPGNTSDYWVTEETKQGRLRLDRTRFNKHDDGTVYDFSKAIAGFRLPVVAHELGQWVVYPSYDEIGEYTGVQKPRNLEVFRRQLEQRGMGHLATVFQQASGRFAAQVYKEDIESALRTPNLGGFQLLQLTDYPGQGEALVGLLDSLWNTKCLISPEAFRHFCGATVPLCRFDKFAWTNDEIFEGHVELAHYGPKPIHQGRARWRIKNDTGHTLHAGTLRSCTARSGELIPLGTIRVPLAECRKAARWTIEVIVGHLAANSWRIWVYPGKPSARPQGITLTSSLSEALERLNRGEKVLLCLPSSATGASLLKLRFLPVFWSFAMFKKQPGVLGVVCDPAHPALAEFPTEMHSDWQWWSLTEGTNAFILDNVPVGITPIVQVIDGFHRNHKLGMVLEARVGTGKLLLCSLPLADDLSAQPVRRQMLASLLTYASSASWNPSAALQPDILRMLCRGE